MAHAQGIYERFVKRGLDLLLSILLLALFWWVLAVVAALVRVKIGKPVLFTQLRPGKEEKIFKLYKFRTMTDECDDVGNLLSDKDRLTSFGRKLRETSLDELPEVLNIIKGDMSIVGPRPQLVRDMVFMSDEQRKRHVVRPGLTGLAQVRGRNAISWDEKLAFDLEYVGNITFSGDCRIFLQTIRTALVRREGITEEGMATSLDYGDYLLATGRVTPEDYASRQAEARFLLEG